MTESEREKARRRRYNESLPHPALEYGKIPPQCVDIEEVVLGAMMIDTQSVMTVRSILSPEMFYKDAHQKICKAVYQLYDERKPVDILTVTNQLRTNGELELIGGPYYIGQLTNRVSSGANSQFHARIIYEKYIAREVISISSEAIKKAFEDTEDPFEVKNELAVNIGKLDNGASTKTSSTDDISKSFYDRRNMQDSGKLVGIPTGIAEFDRLTGGMQNTDLITIGSFSSNFKSTVALNIFTHAAECGYYGKFYSLEMSEIQLFIRQIGILSGENPREILINGVYDRDKVDEAIKKLKSHKSKYSDKLFHIRDIKNDIINSVQNDGIKFIVLDYIQLCQYDSKSRTEGVGGIANLLKSLCNELNIPIILVSQLTKPITTQSGVPRPPSGDMLKESSDIFASSDVVLLPYCPYNPPTNATSEMISFKDMNGKEIEMPTITNGNKLLVMNMEKGRSYGVGKWFNYVDSSLKVKNSITTSNSFPMAEKQNPIKPNEDFDNPF